MVRFFRNGKRLKRFGRTVGRTTGRGARAFGRAGVVSGRATGRAAFRGGRGVVRAARSKRTRKGIQRTGEGLARFSERSGFFDANFQSIDFGASFNDPFGVKPRRRRRRRR